MPSWIGGGFMEGRKEGKGGRGKKKKNEGGTFSSKCIATGLCMSIFSIRINGPIVCIDRRHYK